MSNTSGYPLLQGKWTDSGRTERDNRLPVEALLWIARTGSPWRYLPALLQKVIAAGSDVPAQWSRGLPVLSLEGTTA